MMPEVGCIFHVQIHIYTKRYQILHKVINNINVSEEENKESLIGYLKLKMI